MLSFPLPLVVSVALAYAAVRAWLGDERGRWPMPMVVLVLALAAQSCLVALVQHYGWQAGRWLQPVTASALPPLTWCAFVAGQIRPLRARDAVHGLAPSLVLLALVFWRDGVDLLVIAPFVLYGLALLLTLRTEAAELPLARLGSANTPRRLWRWMALGLLVSALGDGLIYLDQVMHMGQWRAPLISAMSSLMLLSLGLVSLSPEWRMAPRLEAAGADAAETAGAADSVALLAAPTAVDSTAADQALLAQLEAHMRDARPWLNPDLTLVALARKLGVPSKSLSTAVNLGHGENVARYVNRHRIEHACSLMRAGQPVTSALYDSGFNTKSNFHREFLRIHQMAPTQWLEQHRPEAAVVKP